MGACLSLEGRDDAVKKDKMIAKQIKTDIAETEQTVKILLLGAGESGKSTIVKQMRIIHDDGFSEGELFDYKKVVRDNILEAIKAIVDNMEKLSIQLDDETLLPKYTFIKSLSANIPETAMDDARDALEYLWADKGVQSCFARRSEYYLLDSAQYFLDNINRIFRADYNPSTQDILRTRVRTTGMVETKFKFKDLYFKIIDVGGQRSERRKWVQCFGDVTAVIFVADISGYDSVLFEDSTTNRMVESLQTFQGICNNRYFDDTAIILFLNKCDIFENKIETTPLSKFFPEYTGPKNDPDAAKAFLLKKFLSLYRKAQHDKTIYHHFTCATDTENVKVIFNAVTDSIIQLNLKTAGLL